MKHNQHRSIKHNLFRISMLTAGAALLISLVAVSAYHLLNYRKSLALNLIMQANIISVNSSAAILFNNQKDAEETLSALKSVPNIVFAVIYTKNGKVFAVYQREKSKEDLGIFPSQKEGYQFGINHLSLLQPIVVDNETIGTIYINSDLKDIYIYLLLHILVIIIVILISLVVAGLFLTRLHRTITSPLAGLVGLMRSVSEGRDYSIRAPIQGPAELQYLSAGFNRMLEQIQKRDSELELHSQHLEEMVERRTSELAKINEQLKQELAERERAEALIISTKARLQHLLVSSPAVIYSCKPDADLPFTFVSDNVREQLGYEPGEFFEDIKFWSSHIYPDDRDKIMSGLNCLLKQGHHIQEYRFRHKDGAYLWVRDEMRLISDNKGEPLEIVGYWIDITERRNAEEQLAHRALYDHLTKLPNRSLFIDRLGVAIEHKKRYGDYLFAVMFMDVDRFKIINDSLGHLIGDQLLIMIARRLKKSLRAFDTISRLGGDEFAVLFENIKNITDIDPVIERIRSEMKEPFNLSGREVLVTISMGIALSNMSQYTQPEEILRDADIAMYYAKESGKACHMLFDSSMHAKAVKFLQMEIDLRTAIEHKEFVLFYQPIVTINDRKIIGFEALLRWQSPKGIIPPDEFIPVAEETGLIIPMGHWILKEACRQMREWQERFPGLQDLTISVNLTTKEFSQPDFVQLVENVLQETGLKASSLKLELTEKMIIENFEHAAKLFKQLRALNIQMQIDDFGTGHSALNYLLYLPIDAMKIDRSFVNRATVDEDVKEIVRTIVALARTMKMDVIVEGIETEDELSLFRKMESEYAQGFLFSKPLESKAVEELFATENSLNSRTA